MKSAFSNAIIRGFYIKICMYKKSLIFQLLMSANTRIVKIKRALFGDLVFFIHIKELQYVLLYTYYKTADLHTIYM